MKCTVTRAQLVAAAAAAPGTHWRHALEPVPRDLHEDDGDDDDPDADEDEDDSDDDDDDDDRD